MSPSPISVLGNGGPKFKVCVALLNVSSSMLKRFLFVGSISVSAVVITWKFQKLYIIRKEFDNNLTNYYYIISRMIIKRIYYLTCL